MKNIGIFTHDLYPHKPWGQGRYVYDLVRHLRPLSRRKIYIFAPAHNAEDPLHINVLAGSHKTIGKNVTYSITLGAILEGLIRQYNLGLVHLQGGPGGLFLLRKPSIPMIYTIHHTYHQQAKYVAGQSWKLLLFLWEKYSYQGAHYLLCDSPSTFRVLYKSYGVHGQMCKVVPCGVDVGQFFSVNQSRIPFSLLFLGRLETRKGIDFLVSALPYVKDVCPEIKLFIAGEGNLRHRLGDLIKKINLESNVHFLGTIEDAEINAWYNKVCAVVIPSVFEGFGLTAIEAMAAGTPVIATDVDGLRDLIRHGENGLLVPYGDGLALAAAINGLLTNREKHVQFSENGQKTVRLNYDWKIIVGRFLDVYESVLEG